MVNHISISLSVKLPPVNHSGLISGPAPGINYKTMKVNEVANRIIRAIEAQANGSRADEVAALRSMVRDLVIELAVRGKFMDNNSHVDPAEMFRFNGYIQNLINQSNEKDQ